MYSQSDYMKRLRLKRRSRLLLMKYRRNKDSFRRDPKLQTEMRRIVALSHKLGVEPCNVFLDEIAAAVHDC